MDLTPLSRTTTTAVRNAVQPGWRNQVLASLRFSFAKNRVDECFYRDFFNIMDARKAGIPARMQSITQLMKRHSWIGIIAQTVLVVLLALALASTPLSGRLLLMAASVWFATVLQWNMLGPWSFFLSLGKGAMRTKIALVFAFGYFYQLFIFGWLAPLAAGIYRVTKR